MLHSSSQSVPHFGEVPVPEASRGATTQKFNSRSLCSALVLMTAGVLATPAAHADIIFSPASIVDHGSYITDTANGLDWYKFSNAENTVGLSYNAVGLAPEFASWSVASIAQVQGLEQQFGWTADSPGYAWGDNFGITDAMADYLGYTSQFFIPLGNGSTTERMIMAMTSDTFFTGANGDIQEQMVTMSETFTDTDLHLQNFYYGDLVDGNYGTQLVGDTDIATGTWLVRAHQSDGGGGAVPDIPSVPDAAPTSLLCLMGILGVISFGSFRRRPIFA